MRLAIVLATALLAGCMSVQSNVAAFHTLPARADGRTIAIFPGGPDDQASLERRTYISALAQHFESAGYRVVDWSAPQRPDYVATFVYGIDDGTLVTRSFAIPQWGVTGYTGSTTNGTVNTYGNTATYNANTTYHPTYGVTGYTPGSTTTTVYKRAILLTMFDASKMSPADPNSIATAKVYESRVLSAGSCGSIAVVIKPMLDALFEDFPGESGKPKNVTIHASNDGCQ